MRQVRVNRREVVAARLAPMRCRIRRVALSWSAVTSHDEGATIRLPAGVPILHRAPSYRVQPAEHVRGR